MKKTRRITLLISIAVLVWIAVSATQFHRWRTALPPVRFLHQSEEQLRNFADACSQILRQHPCGENESVDLPVASMPPVIALYNPERILVTSNRFLMLVGEGRLGFGVSWEQSPDDPERGELWHHWDGDHRGPLYTRP